MRLQGFPNRSKIVGKEQAGMDDLLIYPELPFFFFKLSWEKYTWALQVDYFYR